MCRVRGLRAGLAVAASLIAAGPALTQVAPDTTRQIQNQPTLGAPKLDQVGQPSLDGGSAPRAEVLGSVEGRVQLASRPAAESVNQGELRRTTTPEATLRGLTSDEEAALERARAFADEATRVLDEIMPALERHGEALRVAQASTLDRQLLWSDDTERNLYARFVDWLDRSARDYSTYIVGPLASGTVAGAGSDVGPGRGAPARRAQVGSGAEQDLFDRLVDSVRRWFDKANRDYQSAIVRNLSDPPPTGTAGTWSGTTPKSVAVEASKPGAPPVKTTERFTPPAKTPVVAQKSAEPDGLEWLQDRVGRWFSRSNKDYNDIIVKKLSEPTGARPGDVAALPVRVPDRIEPPKAPVGTAPRVEEIKRDDAARLAEIERERAQAAEAQRLAALKLEEERALAAAEAAQRAEMARKAQEEQERLRLAAAEAAQRAEVLKREEQQRQQKAVDDAKRLAATEAARREEQQRQQKAAEDARKAAAAEAARLAEAQRAADEAERRRVAEAERRLAAERAQAEAVRRAEERARQVAAIDQTARTPRRAAERPDASSRVASAPRRAAKSGSAARRAYAKDGTRSGRQTARVAGRVQRARSGPAIAKAAYRGKARVRPHCAVSVVVPRVVVVEVRGGVYQSVFERDFDRRRIVVAYNSPLVAGVYGRNGCDTTIAVAPE